MVVNNRTISEETRSFSSFTEKKNKADDFQKRLSMIHGKEGGEIFYLKSFCAPEHFIYMLSMISAKLQVGGRPPTWVWSLSSLKT